MQPETTQQRRQGKAKNQQKEYNQNVQNVVIGKIDTSNDASISHIQKDGSYLVAGAGSKSLFDEQQIEDGIGGKHTRMDSLNVNLMTNIVSESNYQQSNGNKEGESGEINSYATKRHKRQLSKQGYGAVINQQPSFKQRDSSDAEEFLDTIQVATPNKILESININTNGSNKVPHNTGNKNMMNNVSSDFKRTRRLNI